MMPPPLLPAPSEIAFGDGAFWLGADVSIVLPEATDDTFFAARQLQTAISTASGLTLPIRKTTATGTRAIELRSQTEPSRPER